MATKRSELEKAAHAVLTVVYKRPPGDKVALAAERLRAALPRAEAESQSRLAAVQAKLDALQARFSAQQSQLESLRTLKGESATLREQYTVLQDEVTRTASETEEARGVARRLWAAMPSEGKLAFFESDQSWLPEWMKPSS